MFFNQETLYEDGAAYWLELAHVAGFEIYKGASFYSKDF